MYIEIQSSHARCVTRSRMANVSCLDLDESSLDLIVAVFKSMPWTCNEYLDPCLGHAMSVWILLEAVKIKVNLLINLIFRDIRFIFLIYISYILYFIFYISYILYILYFVIRNI